MIILKTIVVLLMSIRVSAAIDDSQAATALSEEDRWQYSLLIAKASNDNNMDPLLIAAVMWNESDFRNLTVNRTKDYGLMQVHWQKMGRGEGWLSGVTKDDLLVPEINIPVGVRELVFWRKTCRKRGHKASEHFWVSHYKWGNVVRSDRYERRILRRYRKLIRSQSREANAETTRRRSASARRSDERRANGQVSRSETGVSVVALY